MKNKHLKTFVVLSGLTTITIYGINKLIFHLSTIKNYLSDSNGSYYDWRFGKIFYKTYGSGNPLILIHNLNENSSGYEWNKLIEKLSKSNTVYVIDLLGCGRSEKSNITYTNYIYVQLISDFIKNVIKHKTDVIAGGLSSSFVLMACKIDPDLFGKIMMIQPNSLKSLSQAPSKRSKTLKFIINTPIIGTLVYNMLSSKKQIEKAFAETYFYNTEQFHKQEIALYCEAAHLGGPHAKYLFSSLKGGYLNINIYHALKEINNSIFILAGKESEHIIEIIKEYMDCNPAIEAEYIEKCKALPQLEKPEEVLEQIRIFFETKEPVH